MCGRAFNDVALVRGTDESEDASADNCIQSFAARSLALWLSHSHIESVVPNVFPATGTAGRLT